MLNFTYNIPTQVMFGKGQIERLTEVLDRFGKNVLLVYGGGSIKRMGLYDDVMKRLADGGFTVVECDGVESEESGQLDVYADFIAKLTFKGRPMKNYPYVLKLADGSYKTGETNDDGYIIENEIPIGKVQII